MAPTAARNDPYLTAHFFVEIDGITQAAFRECSNLEVQTEVFEYKEGGLNEYTHKLPGRSMYNNVTLRYGVSDTPNLWEWYQDVVRGTVERKNISIVLYNSRQEEVRRWNLRSAYPVKWAGPPFSAENSQAAVESLEIAYHGFEVQ